MESKKVTSRTRWAEQNITAFLSMPLISEFVFYSPQPGLLISLKSQENPDSRTPEKTETWVRKTAKELSFPA
jgi:hypothetical protein